MRTVIIPVACSLATFMLAACGTLALKPDFDVSGDYPLNRSEAEEIQRVLLAAGIRCPISGITRSTADEAFGSCGPCKHFNEYTVEMIDFRLFRRNGRWHIDKSSIRTRRDYILHAKDLTKRWSERLAASNPDFR